MLPDSALPTALEAARLAGGLLRRKWGAIRSVRYKGPRDIVTDADESAQAAIRQLIQSRFPDHAFLGEEGPAAPPTAAGPLWVVDPLDGTSNYARQFPFYCVSIALCVDGVPQVGVIFDPVRHETFQAVRGQGAFLASGQRRARPFRVSPTDNFAESLIGVDWSREPHIRSRIMAAIARVGERCRTVRATGSAALSLVYVAAGRLDGYVNLSLAPWDVAAASLLILEAGGTITTPSGAPWRLGQVSVAASNTLLHAALIEALSLTD